MNKYSLFRINAALTGLGLSSVTFTSSYETGWNQGLPLKLAFDVAAATTVNGMAGAAAFSCAGIVLGGIADFVLLGIRQPSSLPEKPYAFPLTKVFALTAAITGFTFYSISGYDSAVQNAFQHCQLDSPSLPSFSYKPIHSLHPPAG